MFLWEADGDFMDDLPFFPGASISQEETWKPAIKYQVKTFTIFQWLSQYQSFYLELTM